MADTKQDKTAPPAQPGTTAPPDEGHRLTMGDLLDMADIKGEDLAPYVNGLREAVAAVRPAFNAANVGAGLQDAIKSLNVGGALKKLAETYKAHTEKIAAALSFLSDFAPKLAESTRAGNEYLFWRVKGDVDRANALKADAKPHVLGWLERLDDEIIPFMRPGDEDRLRSLKGGRPLELDDFTKDTDGDRSIIARYVKLLSLREKKAQTAPADDFHLTPPEATHKKAAKTKEAAMPPEIYRGKSVTIDPARPLLPEGSIFEALQTRRAVGAAVEKCFSVSVSHFDELLQSDDVVTNSFAGNLAQNKYVAPYVNAGLLPVIFTKTRRGDGGKVGDVVQIHAELCAKLDNGDEYEGILIRDGKTQESFRMLEDALVTLYLQGVADGYDIERDGSFFFPLDAIARTFPGGDTLAPDAMDFWAAQLDDLAIMRASVLTNDLKGLKRFKGKEKQLGDADFSRKFIALGEVTYKRHTNGQLVRGFALFKEPAKLKFTLLVKQLLSIPPEANYIYAFKDGRPRLKNGVALAEGETPKPEQCELRKLCEFRKDKDGTLVFLKQKQLVHYLIRETWRAIDDHTAFIKKERAKAKKDGRPLDDFRYSPFELLYDKAAADLGMTFKRPRSVSTFYELIENSFDTWRLRGYIPPVEYIRAKTGQRRGQHIGLRLDFKKYAGTFRLPLSYLAKRIN